MADNEGTQSHYADLQKNLKLLLIAVALHWLLTALAGGFILVVLWLQPGFQLPSILTGLFTIPNTQGQTSPILTVIDILVNLVGVAGSLALSAALAFIYLNQNSILNEQTEIQQQQREFDERQTDIMQGKRVPMLTAHETGVQLHPGRPSTAGQSENGAPAVESDDDGEQWVSILVENHGQTAEQLQLACLVSHSGEANDEIVSGTCDVEVEGMVTEPRQGEGGLLPGRPGLSLLRAEPEFTKIINGTKTFCTFLEGIRKQVIEKENRVRFGFVLIFSNSIGGRFKLPLDYAYSIQPDYFDSREQITMTALQDRHWRYPIKELMQDIDWEIPEEAFKET